jgi:hypothetical protein
VAFCDFSSDEHLLTFAFLSSIEWYVAHITAVNADTLRYDVQYLNGDKETGLCYYCVRPFDPYEEGEMVEYLVQDEGYWTARVVESKPEDDEFTVVLLNGDGEDDELMEYISSAHLRRLSEPVKDLEPGAQVVAYHPKEASEDGEIIYSWHRAIVQEHNIFNDTYTLLYKEVKFDGAVEEGIEPEDIRLYEWAM